MSSSTMMKIQSLQRERSKAKRLIEVCQRIVDNYSAEDIDEYAKHYDEEEEDEDEEEEEE